ncbi:MAG: conjugal transfer protein TraX [Defluviitaleaceae bacterium]|nr:conjugal transfer protein TraX [Defluviitaleaceae bacterium]
MLKLDATQLKWIAVIGMTLSHIVIAWWDIIPIWLAYPMYIAGGFTFPIMAFFVAQGYRHTSNLKRYILRLLVMGLIATPFHYLALSVPMGGGNPTMYPVLGIVFAIIYSLLVLALYDRIRFKFLFWLIYIILLVPVAMLLEWYFVGVTMVLMHHIIKNETAKRIVPGLFASVCFSVISLGMVSGFMTAGVYIPEGFFERLPLLITPEFATVQSVFPIGMILATVLVYNFNGERGNGGKWLFYIFYPVHLIVLTLGMWILNAL